MKKIKVSINVFTIIDNDDFERVRQFIWYKLSSGYVSARAKNKSFYLHRFILDAKPGTVVDHINGDKLDNRKKNLRFVTFSQNRMNSTGRNSKISTSNYKGVCKKGKSNNYVAVVTKYGIQHYLGKFKSEIEAAKAYDEKAKELFGKYAKLNFPN